MSKRLLATAVILALIFVYWQVPLSTANFIPTKAEIDIFSPLFYPMPSNMSDYDLSIYQTLFATVRVPLNAPQNYQEIYHIYYCLDGYPAIEFSNVSKSEKEWFSGSAMHYFANASLSNLEKGNHTIRVYTQGTKEGLSASREFTLNTSLVSISASPNSNQNQASIILSNPILPTAIAVVIVIVAFTSILLIYFKRRRGKP
jgi:hypothetical protein